MNEETGAYIDIPAPIGYPVVLYRHHPVRVKSGNTQGVGGGDGHGTMLRRYVNDVLHHTKHYEGFTPEWMETYKTSTAVSMVPVDESTHAAGYLPVTLDIILGFFCLLMLSMLWLIYCYKFQETPARPPVIGDNRNKSASGVKYSKVQYEDLEFELEGEGDSEVEMSSGLFSSKQSHSDSI